MTVKAYVHIKTLKMLYSADAVFTIYQLGRGLCKSLTLNYDKCMLYSVTRVVTAHTEAAHHVCISYGVNRMSDTRVSIC